MNKKNCGQWDCMNCGKEAMALAAARIEAKAKVLAAQIQKDHIKGLNGGRWEMVEALISLEQAALLVAGSASMAAINLTGFDHAHAAAAAAEAPLAALKPYKEGMKSPVIATQETVTKH